MNDFKFRTIVTGFDRDGRSVFVSDDPTPVTEIDALPGTQLWLTWGTPDGTPVVGPVSTDYTFSPVFPGPNGTRFMFASWAPMPAEEPPALSEDQVAAVVADAEAKMPGLLGVLEPEEPGFHTTDTIDYAVLLDGELVLVLDDGAERTLTPGTCVVQRGTRHAWQNRSDRPALIMYVLIGAQRGGDGRVDQVSAT